MTEENEIAIDEVIGNISHSIKSPIASIKALIFLTTKQQTSKKDINTFKKIDEKLDQLNLNIDNAIQFLYSSFNLQKEALEIFDLSKEVQSILKEMKIKKLSLRKTKKSQIVGNKKLILESIKQIIKRVSKISQGKISMEVNGNSLMFIFRTTMVLFPSPLEDKENWLKLYLAKKSLLKEKSKIFFKKNKNMVKLEVFVPNKKK